MRAIDRQSNAPPGHTRLDSTSFKFTEFTEAAEVHSNDDGISRHRLAPYNAYYLT